MVRAFQERWGIAILNLSGSNEGMSLAAGADVTRDPEEGASCFPRAPRFKPPYGKTMLPHMETRIVDVQTRRTITKTGTPGELLIRGPALFDGYYKAPDLTAQAFSCDGSFETGDLFEIADEGRVCRFVGRCKDLIIRGGFNIAPEEIDQLLGPHPKLTEACAFGIPDAVLGERVRVTLVPKIGQAVTLNDITTFLRQAGLAQFKLPESMFLMTVLPRNSLNEVLRRDVAKAFAELV